MNDIKQRLEQELDQIRYQQKLEKGLVLTEDDIHTIFKILRDNDQELKPMLDIMEGLIVKSVKEDYLITEKYINEIFRYYNILPSDDMIRCRHKFFFTESKKLVKKNFFGPQALENVKNELTVQEIFKKL